MMSKVLDHIDSRYRGRLETERLNVNDNRAEASRYGVRYVPTLVFVDGGGREIAVEIGYRTLDEVFKIFTDAGVMI